MDKIRRDVGDVSGLGVFRRACRSLISKRHHFNLTKKIPTSSNAKSHANKENSKPLEATYKELNGHKLHNYEGGGGGGGTTNGLRRDDHREEHASGLKDFLAKIQSGDGFFASEVNCLSKSESFASLFICGGRRNPSPTPPAPNELAVGFTRTMSRDDAPQLKSLLRSFSRDKGYTQTIDNNAPSEKASDRNSLPGGGGGALSMSTSRKWSSTPIMFSNSNGVMKPLAMEKTLDLTLEELCFGCVKRIPLTRAVVIENGQLVEEEETLTIKVKPGWRKGTKITFEGKGNETSPATYTQDVNIVIGEKPHHLFSREGDNLELTIEVPLVDALTGCTIPVPLLGGEKMSLAVNHVMQPSYERVIEGQGMPKSEEGDRGNLHVKFLVTFPTKLTNEQRASVCSILQEPSES